MTHEHLLWAVRACFEDALGAIRQQESVAAKARRVLRKKLQETALPIRSDSATGIDPALHVGFRRTENGSTIYVVHSAAFRDWFPTEAHVRAALLWLHEQGFLMLPDGKTGPNASGMEWAVTSPRWRGEKKVRSIAFRDPFCAPQGN